MHKVFVAIYGQVINYLLATVVATVSAIYADNYWVLGGLFGFICYQAGTYYWQWKNPAVGMDIVLLNIVPRGTIVNYTDYAYRGMILRCLHVVGTPGMWTVPNLGIVCTEDMNRLDQSIFNAVLLHEEAHILHHDVNIRLPLRVGINIIALILGTSIGVWWLGLIVGFLLDNGYTVYLHRTEYRADRHAVEMIMASN